MDRSSWQGVQGESWAAEWRRTDRSFAGVTEELQRRMRSFSFHNALDVGCGAGELSLAVARGRPKVTVCGVDVSPALVAAARERAVNLSNVSFNVSDAAIWTPPAGFAADLVISRHGVMFFDDPVAAFANLARGAAADAGLLFSCFRAPAENPMFAEVARLLPNPPEPPPAREPGPFAFGDRDYLVQVLKDGGWRDVVIDPFDFAMVTGAGEDPLDDAVDYFARIGPSAAIAREMDPDARKRFFERVRKLAAKNCHGGVVSFPAAGWIVAARKV